MLDYPMLPVIADAITHKKLTLAKKLYQRAVVMHNSPSIADKLMSVIVFDLAIETTLNTIITSLESTKTPADGFQSLLSQVDSLLSKKEMNQLSHRSDILRVHAIRNDAQHDARYPSDNDLSDCRTYTRDFLQTTVKDVWDLEFDKISMTGLVQNPKIKKYLENAEEALNKKDFKIAVQQSTTAVTRALDFVSDIITGNYYFPQHVLTSDFSIKNIRTDSNFVRGVEKMKTTLQFVALGLNYTDFIKFQKIAGSPTFLSGDEEPHSYYGTKENLNQNDAEFAVSYAIDTVFSIESKAGDLENPFE